MKNFFRPFFFMLLFLFLGLCAKAQQNYNIHSVYIYSFIKYVEWPAEAQKGDFIIGVLGNSHLIKSLEKMAAAKKAGNRNIIIRKFNRTLEISNCNILFLSNTDQSKFGEVIEKLNNRPTLLITETKGLAKRGSCINFVLKENKLAFELNEAAAQKSNLKVSKELLRLAILI